MNLQPISSVLKSLLLPNPGRYRQKRVICAFLHTWPEYFYLDRRRWNERRSDRRISGEKGVVIMIKCPHEDWESNGSDLPNKQIADLLTHYEAKHCDDQPQQVRDVLEACAKVLGGVGV